MAINVFGLSFIVLKWVSSLSCLIEIELILQAGFVNDLMRAAGKKSILGTASLLTTDGKVFGPSTNKCCRIEDLSLENGSIDDSDNMIPMAVFSAIMLRIKGFREEYKINHLVMSEAHTFRWFVNFLGPAKFQDCTCDPFGAAGPGFRNVSLGPYLIRPSKPAMMTVVMPGAVLQCHGVLLLF